MKFTKKTLEKMIGQFLYWSESGRVYEFPRSGEIIQVVRNQVEVGSRWFTISELNKLGASTVKPNS